MAIERMNDRQNVQDICGKDDEDFDNIIGQVNTNASNLTTHISDTTTHGTTGDVVGTSDSQNITNKNISLLSNSSRPPNFLAPIT